MSHPQSGEHFGYSYFWRQSRLKSLILLSLASMSVVSAAPKVGDRAPEIHLEKLLPEQPVANASFEKFAGKTVVLEMWATWCGPCIAAIPHLNELAEKLKDQPVVFLSVTDEEPGVVEHFLKEHPISGLVGIAHGHSPSSDYGLIGIPGTFLIDSQGRIAGSLDPTLLTAGMIETVMNYREPSAVDRSRVPGPVLPLTTIIRPHIDEPNSEIFKPPFDNFRGQFSNQRLNSHMMSGARLKSIVQMIWDFNPMRIEGDAFDDSNTYDVFLSNPSATRETLVPWEQSVIESAFRVKVTRVTREVDVWVLTKLEARPEMLKSPGTTKDFSNNGKRGHIVVPNAPVSVLAQMLEGAVGRPVVDETGIIGRYDFELAWTGDDKIRSIEVMRKAGFKIELARRPIEYLVVTKVE